MLNKLKFILIAGVLISNIAFAQKEKSFEGVIVYTMEMEDMGLDPTSQAMLGDMQTKVYIKQHLTRTEINMAMANNVTISDNKNKKTTLLMDVMGMKYAIKLTPEDLEKEENTAKDVTIKYLDETKEIAGYKCKKAELTYKKETSVTVYYTNEIKSLPFDNKFYGLKGFPMEYETNQGGIKMFVSAKEIKTEAVDSKLFEIPAGYTETTKEELTKMFGGTN